MPLNAAARLPGPRRLKDMAAGEGFCGRKSLSAGAAKAQRTQR